MRGEALYAHLPVWAQHAAITGYGAYWRWLRFGGAYARHVETYTARESLTLDAWRQWQRAGVTALLGAAADRVPYYRETWSAAERGAARAGRLQAVPLLDKDPLRADPRRFLRDDLHLRRPLVFHTSGSSGTPIAITWSADELRRSLAIREVRSAGWAGVSFTMPRATISGRMVEPDPQSAGPFHRFNRMERQVYLSTFHLRPDTARQYVEPLWRHGVQWMTGFPRSYFLLAQYILDQRIRVPPLKAVITIGEKLTPIMRQAMEEAYGCPVFEEYSSVENVHLASACAQGRLHLSPDAGVVEILRPDGSPCDPGEVGEVVATGLLRAHQPLIRFRLGDLAAFDDRPCPCGRVLPVLQEVVGRVEDVVVGPDGRQVVRFNGVFADQPHVQEGQVVQETLRHIRVKVVPTAGFTRRDVDDLTARVHQRVGPGVTVTVEEVASIPRMAGGKFQAVISRVARG